MDIQEFLFDLPLYQKVYEEEYRAQNEVYNVW